MARRNSPPRDEMQAMIMAQLERAKEEYDEEDRPDSVMFAHTVKNLRSRAVLTLYSSADHYY